MATKKKKVTGIRVSNVIADEAHVEIETAGGEVLNVWYRPSKFSGQTTKELSEEIQRMVTAGEIEGNVDLAQYMFAYGLYQIVINWDLLDDNDDVIPIEFDALSQLPIPVLQLVRAGINDHFFQSYLGGLLTSNGSSPAAEVE